MKFPSRGALILVASAAALGVPTAQAQADHRGPYLELAAGRSHVNYDCGYSISCSSAKTTTGKLVGGYRWGAFGAEAWYADFGRADIGGVLRSSNQLRLRAAGLAGVWYLYVDDAWKGVVRAGGVQVMQTRTDDGRRNALRASFGLGVMHELTPTLAVELAWDYTTSSGNTVSHSTINLATLGLRLGF